MLQKGGFPIKTPHEKFPRGKECKEESPVGGVPRKKEKTLLPKERKRYLKESI